MAQYWLPYLFFQSQTVVSSIEGSTMPYPLDHRHAPLTFQIQNVLAHGVTSQEFQPWPNPLTAIYSPKVFPPTWLIQYSLPPQVPSFSLSSIWFYWSQANIPLPFHLETHSPPVVPSLSIPVLQFFPCTLWISLQILLEVQYFLFYNDPWVRTLSVWEWVPHLYPWVLRVGPGSTGALLLFPWYFPLRHAWPWPHPHPSWCPYQWEPFQVIWSVYLSLGFVTVCSHSCWGSDPVSTPTPIGSRSQWSLSQAHPLVYGWWHLSYHPLFRSPTLSFLTCSTSPLLLHQEHPELPFSTQ